jgi:hypothetical protein
MPGPLVVGVGKLKVNGVQLAVADEIRIMPSDEKREPLVGLDSSVAMQVTYQAPFIEASLRDDPTVDVLKLCKQTGATVVAELRNGSTYTLSEAFYSGDAELDVKDGKLSARWHGASVQRVV